MAIARLGTVATNADGTSVNHTLAAGSDRVVFVALAWEGSQTVSGVTYGGVAMALATDGAQTATGDVGSGTTAQHGRIFALFEDDLPADGVNAVSVSATGNVGIAVVAYSGLDSTLADVAVATNAASDQVQDVTVSIPDANCVCFWSVSNGGSGTYTGHECPDGDAAQELWDQAPTSAVHAGAESDIPVGVTGSQICESTASTATTNRHVILAIVMSEAVSEANASGALTFASEVAGTMDSPRNASGDLSFATSIDVDADFLIEAGGGALSFATQVDGTLSAPASLSGALGFGWSLAGELFAPPPRELSGALAFGWSLSDGALDVEGTVMSGALSFGTEVDGSLSVPVEASGALEFATSIDVDADFIIEADGALEFGWSVAGSLLHVSSASGALSFGWGLSGRLRTQFPGSCVLLDEPAGGAVLEHADASFATLLDEPSGTATLEAS